MSLNQHCYSSFRDKRRRFPAETLPAMASMVRAAISDPTEAAFVLNWLKPVLELPRGKNQLAALHELVRALEYRHTAMLECDPIQRPGATIVQGGDCDQHAVLLASALHLLGYQEIFFVTVGNAHDPAMHVALAVDYGQQYYLDPKPHQRGADFNQRSEKYPVIRYYKLHVQAARVELELPIGARW